MRVEIDPEGLAATAAGLVGSQAPVAPHAVTAAGADPVSVGVATVLAAHTAQLSAVVARSGLQRAAGGAALAHSASVLQGTDVANAAGFTGTVNGGMDVVGAPVAGPTPLPQLPPIPAMPPPPVMPGEAFAAALHAGPGSAGLRETAQSLRGDGAGLRTLAEDTRLRAARIDEQWRSDGNRAADNTREHSGWLEDTAQRYETLAAAAESWADDYDHAAQYTPTPAEFERVRTGLQSAAAAGNLPETVRLQGEYARMQEEAFDAATGYHGSAAATSAAIATTLAPSPDIVRGGGQGAGMQAVSNAGDPWEDWENFSEGGIEPVGPAGAGPGPGVLPGGVPAELVSYSGDDDWFYGDDSRFDGSPGGGGGAEPGPSVLPGTGVPAELVSHSGGNDSFYRGDGVQPAGFRPGSVPEGPWGLDDDEWELDEWGNPQPIWPGGGSGGGAAAGGPGLGVAPI